MASEKRTYTREFKLEAIRLQKSSGKSMTQIEKELGITPYLLSKWVRQFQEDDERAFPGKGKPRDEEVEGLKREIEILRQERGTSGFLRNPKKNTVGIFSNPNR